MNFNFLTPTEMIQGEVLVNQASGHQIIEIHLRGLGIEDKEITIAPERIVM
jgi:hypothetical protein